MNARLFSSLEPLEARIAPAGIVKVTSAGGSVKIVGDAAANDITLSIIAPGDLQIVGNGGTMIEFNGNQNPSASVEDYGKDISVALGDGLDTINVTNGAYYGNVTLDGGAQRTVFNFTGGSPTLIPGSLKILGKDGNDDLTITATGNDFQVGRDLLISLGEGGVLSTLAAARLLIGGKFNLTGGGGVENFNWIASSILAVGGDLTIASGKGIDLIAVGAAADVGITGKLNIKGGDNPPALAPANLGVTAGDEMTVRGLVTATTVAGESVLNLGGNDATEFAAGAKIKTGKGHSVVTLKGAKQTYLGKVSVTAGGATDFIMKPTGFFIGGDFSFKGSAATDTFDLEGAGIITGKVSIDLADGAAQALTFTAPTGVFTSVFGDVSVKQGAKTGTSTTTIAGLSAFKKFTLATGGADDAVKLDNVIVRSATSLALGSGGDTFELETSGATGASFFVGDFKVLLGDGADTSTIGASSANDRAILSLPGTLDAGGGTDTVSDFAALGNVGTLAISNVP